MKYSCWKRLDTQSLVDVAWIPHDALNRSSFKAHKQRLLDASPRFGKHWYELPTLLRGNSVAVFRRTARVAVKLGISIVTTAITRKIPVMVLESLLSIRGEEFIGLDSIGRLTERSRNRWHRSDYVDIDPFRKLFS
jgi:hypothetical protein